MNNYQRYIATLLLLLLTLPLSAQSIEVIQGEFPSTTFADRENLLERVVVLYSTQGAALRYNNPTSTAPIEWYTYDKKGASDEAALTLVATGSQLATVQGDCGYAIKQEGSYTYIWVIDYLNHPLQLNEVTAGRLLAGSGGCEQELNVVAEGGYYLPYYTPIQARGEQQLAREVEISWSTQVWNETFEAYTDTLIETEQPLAANLLIAAPLCDGEITLVGDQFLQEWNLPQEEAVLNYTSTAVVGKAVVTQLVRDANNEWETTLSDGLGGSAPVEVEFCAYFNGDKHTDWQFSPTEDFSEITQHYYNNNEFVHSFTEYGNTYVRLVVSPLNSSEAEELLSCEQFISETFTIAVGESRLEAPNYFTPATTPGENDEWKVAYKSIVKYSCAIFNRWGVKLFESTNPAQGWDGKHHNAIVPPGVYFYVIEAVGSDEKEYNLKGDINILYRK